MESAVDPAVRLSNLPLLTRPEVQQLQVEWNDTHAAFPLGLRLDDLVRLQAERTPEAIAVVGESERLTYRELMERSARLAGHLRTRGARPEMRVGLCLERTPDLIAAILGILESGAAYVPFDPNYPHERVAFMLEDSAAVLVTRLQAESAGDSSARSTLSCWTRTGPLSRGEREDPGEGTGENLAYVIYTSGSTGPPEGRRHRARQRRRPARSGRWRSSRARTCKASLPRPRSASTCRFWSSLLRLPGGGKAVLARNALELPQLLAADEIKLVNTVPSVMTGLLRMGRLPSSVETVSLCGEPLSASLVEEVLRHSNVRRVLDLYGPTEDTVYSTCALRSAEGPTTIGRPISNKRAYILDARCQPVPVGVPGDLYVAGAGVARGYLHRPELTAEKFLPDPFRRAGERMYKTGDRARWLPGGDIQFLGRLDHQVKIRGYRVEIAEIEEALMRHSGVRLCAVVARQEEAGGKRLDGYVVAREGGCPTATQLHDFLRETLPDYMLPSSFVFLDALPLTPAGKLDRLALPAPEHTRPEPDDDFGARTPIEEALVGIWSQVLGIATIGIEDDFFALGGHSLLATQVISRIRDAFHVELPLRDLFLNPTVAGLALSIARRQAERIEPAEMERLLCAVEPPTNGRSGDGR